MVLAMVKCLSDSVPQTIYSLKEFLIRSVSTDELPTWLTNTHRDGDQREFLGNRQLHAWFEDSHADCN